MKQNMAIMAAITGIAILGGSLSYANTFTSSNEGLTSTSDGIGLSGHVTLAIYDAEGNIKKYVQGDNLITNEGTNCVVELLTGVATAGATDCKTVVGSGSDVFDVISIGTSTVAAAEGDVALGTVATTQSPITPSVTSATSTSNGIITWLATFTASGSQVFRESGIFDTTAATNNMLAHKSFTTAATLTSGDTVAVTWTINVA